MAKIKTLFRAAVLLWIGVSAVTAQEAKLRPGRLSSEQRDALVQGLSVAYTTDAEQSVSDVGSARMAALYVPNGTTATPFLPPGKFKATLTGYLKLKLRGEYQFQLKGRGAAVLSFNGQEVLRAADGDLSQAAPVRVELVKGYNQLRIDYVSPAAGDAQLRLYWSSDEFPPEPVPPTDLSHDGRDGPWRAGESLRLGRLLFAQNHCLKCHAAPQGLDLTNAATRMPELARDAPSLSQAGARLDERWIYQWILAPDKLRNQTTMPRVLEHLDEKTANNHAADIAAFLAAQKTEGVAAGAADETLRKEGLALFEDRGCIACHRFTPPDEIDEQYNRVSLHFAAAKYRPAALAEFLQDTRRHYQWSRMPRFRLTQHEALALAAHIRSQSKGKLEDVVAAEKPDPTRGRELFAKVGCANCHRAGDAPLAPAHLPAIAPGNAGKGCLAAPDGAGKAPLFSFSDPQRRCLNDFVKSGFASLARQVPHEFSGRQFEVLNCTACHSRDDREAHLPYVLLDEGERGLPPEPIPNLTWAGEKLQPQWVARQFLGQLDYRPRPHFKAHMPSFPLRGKLLAAGLSAEHGFAPDENPRPKFDDKVAASGAAVAAMNSGLACHRCHAIGEAQATAPFEARSTNLSYASDRLRYDFYHRWMRDPMRIDPTTKMIKFAQDGKKTGLSEYYGGNAHQQFEAVWHYLQRLNEIQRPSGLRRTNEDEKQK